MQAGICNCEIGQGKRPQFYLLCTFKHLSNVKKNSQRTRPYLNLSKSLGAWGVGDRNVIVADC